MTGNQNHVKDTAEKYGVEITEFRPKISIVTTERNLSSIKRHEETQKNN